MMDDEAIGLELEEVAEQKEVVVASNNILTQHGLKKLPMKHQTPEGEKLRAYELVLDPELTWHKKVFVSALCRGSAVFTAGFILPLVLESTLQRRQRNTQKIENIRAALELEEREKGRVIDPNVNVADLSSNLLVKKGKSIRIMTRRGYEGLRKYGRLNIKGLSYEGEYHGEPPTLNGLGTLTVSNSRTLKGFWVNNSIDPSYEASEDTVGYLYGFTGKISCSPFDDPEKVKIIYLAGKYKLGLGDSYEGKYSNGLPNGRGKFVIGGVLFEGSVTTVINYPDASRGYEYTIKPDDKDADDVILSQEYLFSNIKIKKRIPKPTPSVGEQFQPVLSRALTLSQYLKSKRQTMVFVFNDTPYMMKRSFRQSSWGSYYIDPPSSIPSGRYASFHHESTGAASQGFFSYQLNCPESPLQVRCGFATQFLFRKKNRFGGELLLRAHDGELPNGNSDEKLLGNKVEKKTHDARVMEKDRHGGIEMHLGMNNDRTSFFCVRLHQFDANNVDELNIPAKKSDVDRLVLNELKEGENSNFFFRR